MKRRLMLTLAAAFLLPGIVMAAPSGSLADALQPKASLLKIIFGIGRDDHHRFGHHPGHPSHPGHPGDNHGSGNWGHGNTNNGGIAHGYPGNTGNNGNNGNAGHGQNGNGSWGQGGHGGHGGHPGNNGNSSGYPTHPGNGGYNNGGYNNGGSNNGGGYNNGGYNNGGHHNHPAPTVSPQLRQSIQRTNFFFQQAISSVTPYMGHQERAAYAQVLRSLSQELNFQNSLLPYRYQAEVSTIQRRIEDARFSLLSAYDVRTAHSTVLRAQSLYQNLVERILRGY